MDEDLGAASSARPAGPSVGLAFQFMTLMDGEPHFGMQAKSLRVDAAL